MTLLIWDVVFLVEENTDPFDLAVKKYILF